jgi:nudix-type nucleoside diphosphatase (YffH/AdpP family)
MAENTKLWRVDIRNRERILDDFFKVDKYTVSHETFDGGMTPHLPVLVFERGDAVAALLYDPVRRKVIAVNQFRLPTREKGQGRGWLVEAIAGMIKGSREGAPEETPLQCLIREVREETGYEITQASPVSTFFSSPGGSTERIHLFYAEVQSTDQKSKGGGEDLGEDIEIVEYDVDEFLHKLANGEFEDPKLIIAGQWFQARRGTLQSGISNERTQTFEAVIGNGEGKAPSILGIKTGHISLIKDVDVWVNSENTFMLMDRFFNRSVSATIRTLGAQKHPHNGAILEDTIGHALLREMGSRAFVKAGTVLNTTGGTLEDTHNVQRIFHVAAVRGELGQGLGVSLADIELSIDNVLKSISAAKYRSALLPIFGTGSGKLATGDVVPSLVKRLRAFLEKRGRGSLSKIYILAYSEGEYEILRSVFHSEGLELKPVA